MMNHDLAKLIGTQFYPSQLELGFPHIIDKVTQHWKAGTLEAYMDGLLFDKRGDRIGFAQEILAELFAIQNAYRATLPPKPISINTWSEAVFVTHHQDDEIQDEAAK